MCKLLYTTFTHFAVSQFVLQNRFTELRPSEITLLNRVDHRVLNYHTLTHIQNVHVVIAQPKGYGLGNNLNILAEGLCCLFIITWFMGAARIILGQIKICVKLVDPKTLHSGDRIYIITFRKCIL
jgi:hypothetical protein